jgi:hypothetical protein
MTVKTTGFKGQHYQPVDRRVVLRFESKGNSNGGIFQMLFAQRTTFNDLCGCGGGGSTGLSTAYQASGGMNKAIAQNAVIPGQYSPATPDAIFMPPYSVIGSVDLPFIQLTIPASLESGFAATCHLLSAASPYLAATREALFIDGTPAGNGNGG